MHDYSKQYLYKNGRRNRYFAGRWFTVLVIIGLVTTGLVLMPGVFGLRSAALSMKGASDATDVDAIVVLGGGLTSEGLPPPWQQARCRLAAERYAEVIAAGQTPPPAVVTLSGGTPWKPPPGDARGFPITEAASSARYLASLGVPYEHLFEEGFSLDTIGNAYFLRTMHTDVAGWRRLEVRLAAPIQTRK
jgi:uncharacterized SAM-binding protein YcdF (DUF218 family)